MDEIIYDSNGEIDWNANGWPEPNAGYDPGYDGYSTEGMPDDIFDAWYDLCGMLDVGWSSDW